MPLTKKRKFKKTKKNLKRKRRTYKKKSVKGGAATRVENIIGSVVKKVNVKSEDPKLLNTNAKPLNTGAESGANTGAKPEATPNTAVGTTEIETTKIPKPEGVLTNNALLLKAEIVSKKKLEAEKKILKDLNIKILEGKEKYIKKGNVELQTDNVPLGIGNFGSVYSVIRKSRESEALKIFTPQKSPSRKIKLFSKLITGQSDISGIEYINKLNEIFETNKPEDNSTNTTEEKYEIEDYKEINKNETARLRVLQREISALIKMQSDYYGKKLQGDLKHIVKFKGIYVSDNNILGGYFMEKCSYSLQGFEFNDSGVLTSKDIPSSDISMYMLFSHVLRGLKFMNQQQLVHLDLFPRNILYKSNENLLKICDFGFTTFFDKNKKIKDIFSHGKEMYIPNHHHIDFYKEGATLKVFFDYYTFGISVFKLFIEKRKKIPATFQNDAINTGKKYSQLLKYPKITEENEEKFKRMIVGVENILRDKEIFKNQFFKNYQITGREMKNSNETLTVDQSMKGLIEILKKLIIRNEKVDPEDTNIKNL